MSEDDATDRAGEETDPERAERDQRAELSLEVGEEHLVEDEGGCGAVDIKVEPLDGRTDEGTEARSLRQLLLIFDDGSAPRISFGAAIGRHAFGPFRARCHRRP